MTPYAMHTITPFSFPPLGEPLALDPADTCSRRSGAGVNLPDRSSALGRGLHAQQTRVAWHGRVCTHARTAIRAHPGCIQPFVVRNLQRRWCSSATCGNRARISRHYRQATA